jgi:predicted membrane protein
MDLSNLIKVEYIIVFIILIVPGFLIMKIIRLKIPSKDFLLKDMLFEALAYSLLNLSLIGWLPYLFIKDRFSIVFIILFMFGVIIFPILLAFVYIKAISSKWFMNNFNIQTPTAWDWYFSKSKTCILLITLKNGSIIRGYFGQNSYATSYPNEGSIYLEKIYTDNNEGELCIAKDNDGIIIAKNQFDTIEIYNTGEEDNGK